MSSTTVVPIPAFQSCVCTHYGKDHDDRGACHRCDCPCFERPKFHAPTLQASTGRTTRVVLDRDGRDR